MSDELLRKMVLEFIEIHDVCAWSLADIKRMESAMRAALMVLADNITTEMCIAAQQEADTQDEIVTTTKQGSIAVLAAAIRKAAE